MTTPLALRSDLSWLTYSIILYHIYMNDSFSWGGHVDLDMDLDMKCRREQQSYGCGSGGRKGLDSISASYSFPPASDSC